MATIKEIIKDAFELINVVPATQAVPAADEVKALRVLNQMLSDWSMDGIVPWKNIEGNVALVPGQGVYTLPLDNIDIVEARYRIAVNGGAGDDCDVTMYEIEHDEYFDIPCKETEGCPTQFYFKRGVTDGTLYLWPVPNNTTLGTIEFTYNRALADITVLTDPLDVPPHWRLLVVYNLASLLADPYGGDTPIVDRVHAKAAEMYGKAQMFEREGSVFLLPDEDMG